ncbi:MAG: xanthine dehydrogenase family protein subunit M [Bacteroidota bacterium]
MIPNAFEYQRASSVEDALNLLHENGDEAKLLAGGHSLLPAMRLRLNEPEKLIDISRIPELRYIEERDGFITIGAATTHDDIEHSDLIKSHLPMMTEAAGLIGDQQVRNKGTIGGSIAHADPAADWPASLLAAEAEITVKSVNGSRTISAANFFHGLYMTDLAENELITEIRLPIPAAGTRSTYVKFMQPASRFAIVGCAAIVSGNGTADKVRVAFTGVSAKPYRATGIENALQGNAVNADSIASAVTSATDGIDPLSDHFASEDYRRHLAKVFAGRALNAIA